MNVPKLRFKDDNGLDFPEWEEKTLSEITSFIKDGTHGTHQNTENGEYLLLSAKNVKNGHIYYDDSDRRIDKSEFEAIYKNYKLYDGDVLLSVVGTIGRVAVYSSDFQNVAFQRSVAFFRFKNENSQFMAQLFSAKKFQSDLLLNQVVSAQPGIYLGDLAKIQINLPTLHEQTKIANFLTAVDDKIAELTKKVELLQRYKKGAMQQIFSQQLRFKDDNGQDFPEWEEKELGEIFQVTRGNVLSMKLVHDIQSEENPYPVFSSQTMNNGLCGFYNSYIYENSITWTTDGANAGDVNYRAGKFFCTNVCGVLINTQGFANACIAAMINAVAKKYVSYVGNPKLMNNVMTKIQIEFPCVQEQTKIANFLSALDEQINTSQQQLNLSKQYKQSLLQQMFI